MCVGGGGDEGEKDAGIPGIILMTTRAITEVLVKTAHDLLEGTSALHCTTGPPLAQTLRLAASFSGLMQPLLLLDMNVATCCKILHRPEWRFVL